MFDIGPIAIIVIIALGLLLSGIKILKEYERGVVFRLGRMVKSRGPGIIYVIPFIEKMQRVELRTVTMDVPPQDVITRDNVSVKVNAVLYFRVLDPNRAIVEVANYLFATSQLAQVTLRSVCGQAELDHLLSERDRLNAEIQKILDAQTDPWGIKVVLIELKHIDLPEEMQRAMARQAEAERERRARIILADGEFQASQKLQEAASVISGQPMAMQLRFLQCVQEVAGDKNSTLILPIPLELFNTVRNLGGSGSSGNSG
jgi:regulator of protease activity HflC (stomatin/prohibitin superfamily)